MIFSRYIQVGNAVAIPVARALGYVLGLAYQGICGDNYVLELPHKFPQLDGLSSVNTSETENDVIDNWFRCHTYKLFHLWYQMIPCTKMSIWLFYICNLMVHIYLAGPVELASCMHFSTRVLMPLISIMDVYTVSLFMEDALH